MSEVHFNVPGGEVSANDRLHVVAIQAAAVMLKDWFEEKEPSPEQAKAMIEAVLKGLCGSRLTPF